MFAGAGLAASSATVASGTFGTVTWKLSATDSAGGYVCLAIALPRHAGASECGSIFGPSAGRAHGITYLAHTGVPAPDYIAGPVVATAKTVVVALSTGQTIETRTIAPPTGMTREIAFYATELPSRGQPVSVRGVDKAGRTVARLAIPRLATPSESVHGLRSVEAAFYRAKLPFAEDWSPHPLNPYLVPAQKTDPRQSVPMAIRARLVGWAGGGNSNTFKSWQVFVFDRATAAVSFATAQRAHCKPPDCNAIVLRADNVVYFGDRLKGALDALATLHRR
jgi:hypothetical protein